MSLERPIIGRQLQQQPPPQLPDYHFLYVAPGVGIDYVFVAARQFVETFNLNVIHDLSLVKFVPEAFTVAITTLARTDTASMARTLVETQFGERVYHDLLVYDFMQDAELTLNSRAERNEPFGVPLG